MTQAGFETDIHRLREQSGRGLNGDKVTMILERSVDVAISSQIIRAACRPTYDLIIVITGDSSLAPAFRSARDETRERLTRGERAPEVFALGGSKMSHELYPYVKRLEGPSGSVYLEVLMRESMVRKEDLGKPLRSQPLPLRAGLAVDDWHGEGSCCSSPGHGHGHSGRGQQQHQHHHHPHHQQHPHGGSEGGFVDAAGREEVRGETNSGSSSSGASRHRRWCNFGSACKYFEDVEGNSQHFQRFAHVCPEDFQCRFVKEYNTTLHHKEESRQHFALWKHSCPAGLDCPYFAQPDKHRRHIETFTHKAKVLSAAQTAPSASVLSASPTPQSHHHHGPSSLSSSASSSSSSSPAVLPESPFSSLSSASGMMGEISGSVKGGKFAEGLEPTGILVSARDMYKGIETVEEPIGAFVLPPRRAAM